MATGSNYIGSNAGRARDAQRGSARQDFAVTAIAVEQDFRRVVRTLEFALECAEASDNELIAQLSSTKKVAERGLRLSKLLSKLARSRRG